MKKEESYKYKYNKLKRKLKRRERRERRKRRETEIFKSNYRNSYLDLKGGEFILSVSSNALQIYAKDPSGTQNLYGLVPLKPSNTQTISNKNNNGEILQRYTEAPYRGIYIDLITSWWPIDAIAQNFYDIIDAKFNIINICFMVNGEPADIALVWNRELAEISPRGQSYRREILDYAHARQVSILLSSGGATESAYNTDPVEYARKVCDYVKSCELDGVDYDLENFSPGLTANGMTSEQTIEWLVTVANSSRDFLGEHALISFAPQQPYMNTIGKADTWAGPLGGFSTVYARAPTIDYFNVQAYNQSQNYMSYSTIFINSGSDFKFSSFSELSPNIPMHKLVLGKPLRPKDCSSGYNTASEINNFLLQAKSELNFIGNVFTWQWPADEPNPKNVVSSWLSTVTSGL